MKAFKLMTKDVCLANPNQTIREVACEMLNKNVGALPVVQDGRVVGIVTDRDITLRAVAEGMTTDAKVSDIMSRDVKFCREDDNVESVAEAMATARLRRLLVLNWNDNLAGIISIADLATKEAHEHAGSALKEISRPVAHLAFKRDTSYDHMIGWPKNYGAS